MSIDWDAVLVDPLYDALGIAAVLVSRDGVRVDDLTILDKTSGIELMQGNILVQALKPAACVRVSDLERHQLNRDKVRDARLTFNDKSWNVDASQPKPAPGGKGEIYLFLSERSNG